MNRLAILRAILALAAGLAACGEPAQPTGPTSGAVELVVTTDAAAELRFLPGEMTAPASTPLRVVFRNVSTQPHNLTFDAPVAGRTRTIVDAGTSDAFELTALRRGRFAFGCTIHMGMSGTLVVE